MGRLGRFFRNNEGASAVEFALLILPLLLLLLGTVEFGRAMWTRQALYETAISTARCMGVKDPACSVASGPDSRVTNTAKIVAYAQASARNWSLKLTSDQIVTSPSKSCSGVGGFSEVVINYTFNTAVPLLIEALSAGIPLTATACFPNQT